MSLEVNTVRLSQPFSLYTASRTGSTSYKTGNAQLKEQAEEINTKNLQEKNPDFEPADYIIDKEEIKSILFLGIPGMNSREEPARAESHAIDIFA